MSEPLVSVIIPTFNRFKYLLNAIESVKAQSYKNYEIIVVNDESTQSEYYDKKFPENVNLIHIRENPTLECYSEKLWKFIKTDEINKNIFKYKAIEKNKLIKFGKNANLFRKYL